MGYVPYQLVNAGFLNHQPYETDSSHLRIGMLVQTIRLAFGGLTKVIKTAHAKAHFLDAILSQSNGVVLNSVHELCSCKANCITGGSYFRITIDLNYST